MRGRVPGSRRQREATAARPAAPQPARRALLSAGARSIPDQEAARLSLAGAQDKLAVVLRADGSIRLPELGEITTHILKPDSQRLHGLRDLEAFGLALARAVGLPSAVASMPYGSTGSRMPRVFSASGSSPTRC